MLIGIAGVTGVGKSYYKNKLVDELNFEKVKIITNREIRYGEVNSEDKIFLNKIEIQELRDSGKLAYEFEFLGNTYAYTKEEIFSNKNMVFEMHYSCIQDFKRICPNLKVIYLLPKDIEICISKLKDRNLKSEVEKARILEIKEHYNKITTDEKLKNMFDYIVYNNYDKETDEKILNIVKMIKEVKQ